MTISISMVGLNRNAQSARKRYSTLTHKAHGRTTIQASSSGGNDTACAAARKRRTQAAPANGRAPARRKPLRSPVGSQYSRDDPLESDGEHRHPMQSLNGGRMGRATSNHANHPQRAAGPGSRFSSPAAAPGIPVSGRTRAGRACAMTHGRPTGTMQRMPRRSERPRPRTLEVRISRAGIGLAPASTTGGDHDSSHFLVSLAFSIVGPVPLMEYRHRPLLQKITSRVTPALQCSSR
ncbi:hypothetical protein CDC45_21495 (plasmid) [Ralstonia pseudosolanacearum]|uniref:Transmembrane protein n=1 Tax=Ralstonia nicotianae (strain ATCC BAA-1114 / GMI1000) TaxID=267608 RepID=Q8XRQ4_RALN1|nr:hypothetical protein CDC45_21495 [Ralstonia pseudosolanacearum]CAD17928.1 putative transmembrane protein [Ralstonia pseudosolanacearum GMI1000]